MRGSIEQPLMADADEPCPPSPFGSPAHPDLRRYDTNSSPFLDTGNPFTAWCARPIPPA